MMKIYMPDLGNFNVDLESAFDADSCCQELIYQYVRCRLEEVCLYAPPTLKGLLAMARTFDNFGEALEFVLNLNAGLDLEAVESIKKEVGLPFKAVKIVACKGMRTTIEYDE